MTKNMGSRQKLLILGVKTSTGIIEFNFTSLNISMHAFKFSLGLLKILEGLVYIPFNIIFF